MKRTKLTSLGSHSIRKSPNYQVSFFFKLEHCEVDYIMESSSFGRGDSVALGVQVLADPHGVAGKPLVRELVGRGLDEERVFAL